MANTGETELQCNLPADLIAQNILVRLPVKPLVKYRCISKDWQKLLSKDEVFIKKHLMHASGNDKTHGFITVRQEDEVVRNPVFHFFPFDTIKEGMTMTLDMPDMEESSGIHLIMGSSNGILCILSIASKDKEDEETDFFEQADFFEVLSLANPATRECKAILPKLPVNEDKDMRLGFGYLPEMDDCKVVRVLKVKGDPIDETVWPFEVEVYSLRADAWRSIGRIPYHIIERSSRAIAKGAIHWIAYHLEKRQVIILAFDMATEEFLELPLPDSITYCGGNLHVRVSEGCLILFAVRCASASEENLHVWKMMEYGTKESWIKLFTAKLPNGNMPVECWKDGKVILRTRYNGNFVSYDPTNNNIEMLQQPAEGITDLIPYVQSMVSVQR